MSIFIPKKEKGYEPDNEKKWHLLTICSGNITFDCAVQDRINTFVMYNNDHDKAALEKLTDTDIVSYDGQKMLFREVVSKYIGKDYIARSWNLVDYYEDVNIFLKAIKEDDWRDNENH